MFTPIDNIDTFNWDHFFEKVKSNFPEATPTDIEGIKAFLPIDSIKSMQASGEIKTALANDLLKGIEQTSHTGDMSFEIFKNYQKIKAAGGTLDNTHIRTIQHMLADHLYGEGTQARPETTKELLKEYGHAMKDIGIDQEQMIKMANDRSLLRTEKEALRKLHTTAASTKHTTEKLVEGATKTAPAAEKTFAEEITPVDKELGKLHTPEVPATPTAEKLVEDTTKTAPAAEKAASTTTTAKNSPKEIPSAGPKRPEVNKTVEAGRKGAIPTPTVEKISEVTTTGERKWFQFATHDAEGAFHSGRTAISAAIVAAAVLGTAALTRKHTQEKETQIQR